MKQLFDIGAKVAYWLFVLLAVVILMTLVVTWITPAQDMVPHGMLVLAGTFFFLGMGLSELGKLHSDLNTADLLDSIANAASKISDKARSAAKKEEEEQEKKAS